MQDADGAGEQAEHADHGEAAEDGKDERLGHLARDHGEADGGHGETKRERHHESDIAAAAGLICGWLGVTRRRVDVGHASKLPEFDFAFAPDIVMWRVVAARRRKSMTEPAIFLVDCGLAGACRAVRR